MDSEILMLVNMINDSEVKIYRDELNRIIVDGNIIIVTDEFKMFPVKIYKVNGTISWHGDINGYTPGSLTTLENFPDIVNGNVHIFKNPKLTNLKYSPKEITGSFVCHNCNIDDISDLCPNIGKHFIVSNNPLLDVSVLEKCHIGGNIHLSGTKWADKEEKEDIKLVNNSSIIIYNDNSGITVFG